MPFSALGLTKHILQGVQAMGYGDPTPIQLRAIPPALEGRDLIASAQTGTGKTAAFALPTLQKLGSHGRLRCLVLEPTRELAMQVETAMRDFSRFTDLKVGCVYGGVGYGNQRAQGRCNENHRWHPVVQLFRAGAQALWGHVQMNDPQINQLPGTVALTGAHAGCSNAYGVHDMVGNLHEWTSNPAGTFRGGYYMDTTINGNGCSYVTDAHDPSYHDYSIGFRCCAAAAAAD